MAFLSVENIGSYLESGYNTARVNAILADLEILFKKLGIIEWTGNIETKIKQTTSGGSESIIYIDHLLTTQDPIVEISDNYDNIYDSFIIDYYFVKNTIIDRYDMLKLQYKIPPGWKVKITGIFGTFDDNVIPNNILASVADYVTEVEKERLNGGIQVTQSRTGDSSTTLEYLTNSKKAYERLIETVKSYL